MVKSLWVGVGKRWDRTKENGDHRTVVLERWAKEKGVRQEEWLRSSSQRIRKTRPVSRKWDHRGGARAVQGKESGYQFWVLQKSRFSVSDNKEIVPDFEKTINCMGGGSMTQ